MVLRLLWFFQIYQLFFFDCLYKSAKPAASTETNFSLFHVPASRVRFPSMPVYTEMNFSLFYEKRYQPISAICRKIPTLSIVQWCPCIVRHQLSFTDASVTRFVFAYINCSKLYTFRVWVLFDYFV